MLEQYTHFWGTPITSLYELNEKTYSNSSVPDTLNGTDPVLDRCRSGAGALPGHVRDATVLRK